MTSLWTWLVTFATFFLTLYIYTTFAIRKFIVDMPSPGNFQNIAFLIGAQQGSEHVKPFCSSWVKIKEAELKINLDSPIVY